MKLILRCKSLLQTKKQNLARVATLASMISVIGFLMFSVGSSSDSSAGFSSRVVRTQVTIEGRDFGFFDSVGDLSGEMQKKIFGSNGRFHKITLKRDFITDPSLYLWAKSISESHTELRNINLISENRDGAVIARYVLHFAQPVSWSVESGNPSAGGFHEKVDVAVQRIEKIQ